MCRQINHTMDHIKNKDGEAQTVFMRPRTLPLRRRDYCLAAKGQREPRRCGPRRSIRYQAGRAALRSHARFDRRGSNRSSGALHGPSFQGYQRAPSRGGDGQTEGPEVLEDPKTTEKDPIWPCSECTREPREGARPKCQTFFFLLCITVHNTCVRSNISSDNDSKFEF